MTPIIRHFLRKIGRVGLVIILTIISTFLAHLLNFFLVELLGFTYIPFEDFILISSVTILVAPLVSWFLTGLFFKIDEMEVKMSQLATIDSLTNTYNRRYFYEQSEQELSTLSRYKEYAQPAIIILDLDKLKLINDKFGHSGGDKVLVEFSSILLNVINKTDIVGRLGGDEFVIFVKQASVTELQSLIDTILLRVRSSAIELEGSQNFFTVSIGASFIDVYEKNGFDVALRSADIALYQVKNSDRNGCIISGVE